MQARTIVIIAAAIVGIVSSFARAAEPAASFPSSPAAALHCQVPCGIYTDQLRFESMLEDTKTIAKSIAQIGELTSKMQNGELDPMTVNQATRWVTTKEDHASHIQEVVAKYFLAQRIKSDNPEYTNQLITAHKVIVSAMKTKQAADPATADALKAAILDLYRAYEGKEPNFSDDH
jgi:nickel superoxide dismutase